jgi:hypothetical protein
MVSSGQAAIASADPVAAGELAAGDVVKEIDDPQNGNRWLLTRDPSRPGGPGLLRLAGVAPGGAGQRRGSAQGEPPHAALPPGPVSPEPVLPEPVLPEPVLPEPVLPVIRSGDRIILEQHTRVVDARLEAVAIGPARAGAAFSARLLMGGGMVRAVAISAGRALLAGETER